MTDRLGVFLDSDDELEFDELAITISDMADWSLVQVRASLHRVLSMGRESARAQDVEWLRACENAVPEDHTQGRAALHNATDGIEQGWAFLAQQTGGIHA